MRPLHRSWVGVLAALFALVVLPGQALAGNATNINVTLPAAKVSISGKVTRHGGGAVGTATVEIIRTSNYSPAGLAITDSGGNFAFYDLGNDQYIVAVNPHFAAPTYMAGFYRQTSSPDHFTTVETSATKLNYNGTKVTGVNMAVQLGHSISGRIRSAGDLAPLKGVAVSAVFATSLSPTPPFAIPTVKTDATGKYVITGVPNGAFSIKADPNADLTAPRVNFLAGCYINSPPHDYSASCAGPANISVNDANIGSKNIDLPHGRRITGTIKDGQGHNLCATVTAFGSAFTIFPPKTTDCGAFAIVGLAPDDYTVQFRHALSSHFVTGSYATNVRHFVETGTTGAKVHIGNADKNLGLIHPTVGHTIAGTIKDSAGHGIENVPVTLRGATGSYEQVSTNAQGTFAFFGVGSGTHTIAESRGSSGKNLRSGYYRAGATGSFTPNLAQATALSDANHYGIVIKPSAGFVISGRITNAAHQGIQVFISISGTAFTYALSDAQGNYQAIGLDPGDYTLYVGSAKKGTAAYRGGYYDALAAGHYTSTFADATPIHVGP